MTSEEKLDREMVLRYQENAAKNERFVGDCLEVIRAAPDPEEGLRRLLRFLGESLGCGRVYVFEEMDRLHIRNTYEWCGEGVPSGIKQLPYLAKKDLNPWYERLADGGNIIEPDVETLRQGSPVIYQLLRAQDIRSIILSPLLSQGRVVGLFGADNPPPRALEHISVLFDVLAYFVCSLVSQRELQKMREERAAPRTPRAAGAPRHAGRTVLLVDDSRELLRLNERVLRPEGYGILTARTLGEAEALVQKASPDAIVMDVDLPDGDGLAFCRALRDRADIPVVFLTARSDARTAREGLRTGGCALLTKPYQLEELQAAVAAAVEKRAGPEGPAPGAARESRNLDTNKEERL